jgi:hypothetical protein
MGKDMMIQMESQDELEVAMAYSKVLSMPLP